MAVGKLSFTIIILFLMGCSQGNCRRKDKIPEYPGNQVGASTNTLGTQPETPKEARIRVFKYDGSLQCGVNKGRSLKSMAGDLEGVRIYSSEKKSDGLMHIQVCGSSTGMTNVYEIPKSQLKLAEDRGFKLWKFQ